MSELQLKKRRKKPTLPGGEFDEISSGPAESDVSKEQKGFVKSMS
ncbi:hypothetical protein [Wolbachia endosymbiont of Psylliodes chrysocephala]|nr:hypothetical protein [Wolbachia endosymbiont of Psylliodes chrysocephala]